MAGQYGRRNVYICSSIGDNALLLFDNYCVRVRVKSLHTYYHLLV